MNRKILYIIIYINAVLLMLALIHYLFIKYSSFFPIQNTEENSYEKKVLIKKTEIQTIVQEDGEQNP